MTFITGAFFIMRKMRYFCLSTMLLSLFLNSAFAETVYLKDGQVLDGKIIGETTSEITVRTKFMTKRINRDNILRIMYGERKMEKIYLLMNDGTTQTGFLVDQDASQVIIRDQENSPQERSIPKSTIRQMSNSDIVPLDPSIFIRSGVFAPLNSKGSKLKPSICYYAGSDITFQWIKNVRVMAEAGYSKNTSKNKGLYMQFIPIQASASYDIVLAKNLHLWPKLAFGATVVDFNDGEGTKTRSFSFSGNAGSGLVYEVIDRHLFIGLWAEYSFIRDKSSNLHNFIGTAGVSYRF
jgi:hypothetical protein